MLAEKDDIIVGCGGCISSIVTMIGTIMAAIWSWTMNHSWVWATVHAMFGWFYVLYHLIRWGTP